MKSEYIFGQGAVSAAIAWLGLKLGLMFWPLAILLILMVIDYVTGMLASKKEAIEHPRDPAYGWSSRKGALGIIKKVGYMAAIAVAVCLDQIIITGVAQLGYDVPAKGFFGLVVTVWFVLNEMLSVLENVGRMGSGVPPWLARYIAALKGKIDEGQDPPEEGKDGHE